MDPVNKPTNSLAVVSLVCGVASWIGFFFIGSLSAIITGHIARSQIRARNGAEGGEGFALAGLLLGYIHLVLSFIGLLFVFLFFGSLMALASSFH